MTPPFLPSQRLPELPHDRPRSGGSGSGGRRSSFWQELLLIAVPVLITEAAETLREYLRRKRRKRLNTLLEELAEEAEEMAQDGDGGADDGEGGEKPGGEGE